MVCAGRKAAGCWPRWMASFPISPRPPPATRCRLWGWRWCAFLRIGAPFPCIRCCSARLDALYRKRAALGLDGEQLKVLERYHLDFVRAGAQAKGEARDRLAAIAQRLAVLGTQFSQNVLGDEEDWILELTEAQMAGMPAALCEPRAPCPACAGVALCRHARAPVLEPFLQYAPDRALREQLYRAYLRAATIRTTITTALSLPRCWLCGPSGRLFWAMRISLLSSWPIPWPWHAARRALLEEVWGGRRGAGRWRSVTSSRR